MYLIGVIKEFVFFILVMVLMGRDAKILDKGGQ